MSLIWSKSSYSGPEGGQCVEVAIDWRKSTYSGPEGGDCVEVGLDWRKSSHSSDEGGECVEVATTPALVHVRDSKDASGPHLTFSPAAWGDFLTFATTHPHPAPDS
ncbi:DUF397 domain-containing protein [Streptomyces sp. URMC 123]|uniref:DUF397 domain-containing protein n=1 Tax=Streptomyces sp. URMC 123 TaxID=3423403 RepID=UPI003F1A27FC